MDEIIREMKDPAPLGELERFRVHDCRLEPGVYQKPDSKSIFYLLVKIQKSEKGPWDRVSVNQFWQCIVMDVRFSTTVHSEQKSARDALLETSRVTKEDIESGWLKFLGNEITFDLKIPFGAASR